MICDNSNERAIVETTLTKLPTTKGNNKCHTVLYGLFPNYNTVRTTTKLDFPNQLKLLGTELWVQTMYGGS